MSSLGSKIDTHDASIKSVITASQNTITDAINDVNNHVTHELSQHGVIKSIQTRSSILSATNGYTTTFQINAVDTNKTLLLVDSNSGAGSASFTSSTEIVVSHCKMAGTNGSKVDPYSISVDVQIVEFY